MACAIHQPRTRPAIPVCLPSLSLSLSLSPTRSLALALALVLSVLTCTHALPLRSAHAVPDHWAQLLAADRYSFVTIPSRALHDTTVYHNDTLPHLVRRARAATLQGVSSRVQYEGPQGDSKFRCEVVNAPTNIDVKAAVAKVLTVMAGAWRSPVLVNVRLEFKDLGEPTFLASGGGTYFVKMDDKFNTILPIAAAEAVRGKDLNANQKDPGNFDVIATVNTNTLWYVGDSNPGENEYDLITVVLHEFYHNLLFAGSVVVDTKTVDGQLTQSASLHEGYQTRFDSFLATGPNNCGVLTYLQADSLASQSKISTGNLLANAVCSNELFWWDGRGDIVQLFAPSIFQKHSSIYHFSSEGASSDNRLMFPSVKRGDSIHTISQTMRNMQAVTLDPAVVGSTKVCTAAYPQVADSDPYGGQRIDNDAGDFPLLIDVGGARIANMPIWGFALLIVLCILFLLLLLGLCIMLLFCRKKPHSPTRGSRSYTLSSFGGGGGTASWYNRKKSSARQSSHSGGGWGVAKVTKKAESWGWSDKKDKKGSASSKSGRSKWEPPRPSTEHNDKEGDTCPSSGKKCICCECVVCRPVQRPAPVASVHRYVCEPAVVPKKKCRKKKRAEHHHHHHHYHAQGGIEKSVKKVCRTARAAKSCHQGCHCCHCCRYKPASSRATSRCTKTSARCNAVTSKAGCSTSRMVPPSIKPPSSKCRRSSSGKSISKCRVPATRTPPSCVPATTCIPDTTTCGPSTRGTCCRDCRSTKSCRCTNRVEVNIDYRC